MQGLASPDPRQLPGVGSRGTGSPCSSLLACFAAGALLWVAWAAERGWRLGDMRKQSVGATKSLLLALPTAQQHLSGDLQGETVGQADVELAA